MFLRRLSKLYEIVIFTASLSKYADVIIDRLDPDHFCKHRLYREHCQPFQYGSGQVYVKNLDHLGRQLKDTLIIDNSPVSYLFNQSNALPIKTWIEDQNDIELYKYLRLLEFLADSKDVRREIQQVVDRNTETIDFEKVEKLIQKKKQKPPIKYKKVEKPAINNYMSTGYDQKSSS